MLHELVHAEPLSSLPSLLALLAAGACATSAPRAGYLTPDAPLAAKPSTIAGAGRGLFATAALPAGFAQLAPPLSHHAHARARAHTQHARARAQVCARSVPWPNTPRRRHGAMNLP